MQCITATTYSVRRIVRVLFFFLFDLNSTTTPIGRLKYILIVALHGARSSAGAVF